MEKKELQTPYDLFGWECAAGWHPIVSETLDKLYALNIDIQIFQVKEKFGGLCIYVDKYNDEVKAIIRVAEEKASHTCEICGKYDLDKVKLKSRPSGWSKTLCDTCFPNWVKYLPQFSKE